MKGIFFTCAAENENLLLDKDSSGFTNDMPFRVIGAWYGNAKEIFPAMQKMEHYEYFKWNEIAVNHELFPSHSASDDTEYLTLVYLNSDSIHTISCPENDVIYYGKNRTQLFCGTIRSVSCRELHGLHGGRGRTGGCILIWDFVRKTDVENEYGKSSCKTDM